jgi:flavin-binding protein dodecin
MLLISGEPFVSGGCPPSLYGYTTGVCSAKREEAMTIAKVIEISSASSKGMEDAVTSGLKKVAKTVKNIKGAWVNEIKVVTNDDGTVTEWRVNMRVNFIVK